MTTNILPLEKIKTLDVTLRDGGYKNNFHFIGKDIMRIIKNLEEAGIDYIEVGYRNGSFKPIEDIGVTGKSTNEYLQNIKNFNQKAKLSVIYHPKNVLEQDIIDMSTLGINLLRCCFDFNNVNYTLRLIEKTRELALVSGVNFTRISQLPRAKLLENARMAVLAGAEVLYLADSNGSLLPHEVASLVSEIKENFDIEVGFHAHNNLNLATANSIAAVNSGATFIDSSLRGMGKGAGNLQTEFWIAYLLKLKQSKKYNLGIILELVDYLTNNLEISNPQMSLFEVMVGSLDFSADERSKLCGLNYRKFNKLFINKYFVIEDERLNAH